MATGTNIRTYFEGTWHNEDLAVMRAADHGSWLGTTVFDGARYFNGVAPDLHAHCARINRSAEALMITPTVSAEDMVALVWEGLAAYSKDEGLRQRLGRRRHGKCGRDSHRQRLHGPRRRAVHPGAQRHLPRGHHPGAAHGAYPLPSRAADQPSARDVLGLGVVGQLKPPVARGSALRHDRPPEGLSHA